MSEVPNSVSWMDEVIARAERNDPRLQALRLAVDEAGFKLAHATSTDRSEALEDYRAAMRQFLHYLTTTYISTPT